MLKNCFFLFVFFSIYLCEAQKVAYVDSKYILNNIPEFTSAQEEIEDLSKMWEEEIQNLYLEVEKMYKSYQAENIYSLKKKKKLLKRILFQENKK